MPAALLDTNAVSDLMRDHPRMKARVASPPGSLVINAIVQGEIRYGLERLPAGKKRADLETRAQAIRAALPCEPLHGQVADVYGHLKALLDGRGLNLQDNDLWIAPTALTHGMVLVSRDPVFAHVPGLPLEDWTA
jgi:predicted nucleic acid-binding protein